MLSLCLSGQNEKVCDTHCEAMICSAVLACVAYINDSLLYMCAFKMQSQYLYIGLSRPSTEIRLGKRCDGLTFKVMTAVSNSGCLTQCPEHVWA